ncbi:TetR/AcrR family transcriptional regulator [Aestuariimicrobium ganziense]|uniref:TetR/AcrR family transcriptional regulator n=1 Tax=Aestuariimicrobium ganziense TaxID=2773677 RepID=UPI001942DE03|nr:TetR/AcrR family transcriptional regulator [Aestuariimicrobium ganziense]
MATSTRAALLDAAQDRFASRGYAGTSIRQLASAVGIRESSVYKHFPSKQAILAALLERATERVHAVAATWGVSVDDPTAALSHYQDISTESLGEMAVGFLEMWLHDPDLVAVRRMLALEQYRTPEAGALLRELTIVRPLTFQTHLFAQLITAGGFRAADPEAVALAFWGPILAIVATAEAPGGEAAARRMLQIHLEHFTLTHVVRDSEGEA